MAHLKGSLRGSANYQARKRESKSRFQCNPRILNPLRRRKKKTMVRPERRRIKKTRKKIKRGKVLDILLELEQHGM